MEKHTLLQPPETAPGVVYCLIFSSGKKYVGISSRMFCERAHEHLKSAKYMYKQNEKAVVRAIRKYGPENVEVKILAEGINSKDELNRLEIEYIKEFDCFGTNGYNMTTGGEGTNGFFSSLDEETKKRIRAESRERINSLWQSSDFRRNVVSKTKERTNTPEYKEKARERITKLNSNPDFVKARDETFAKARITQKWKENFEASVKRRSENPEWVKSQGDRLRSYYSNPENKQKSLDRLAEMNADKDFQKRRIESCRKSWSNPKLIAEQAARNKAAAKIKEHEYMQIKDLYKYGFNGKEIAKMYAVNSPQTIYNILAKIGVKPRNEVKP